jgi:glycosyltransferase involved in cell wall biosynthesis
MAELPLVSVVVIGRNEGERLARCLVSIRAMDTTGFAVELIYVDSGSTDDSVVLAQSFEAKVVALQAERPSAASGRNAGWRVAKGETVLFLDGDTVLHPEFVRNSLLDLAETSVAIVWGHRREMFPERSIYNRVLDLDWVYAPGPSLFCGGDALFRREALERTSGFDDTLIAGEEPELCRRIAALGYAIKHVDRPMTGHDLAMTRWSQYWKRATRAGHAYAEVSAQLGKRGEVFWVEDARRNRNRALTLIVLPVVAFVLAIFLRSVWPVVAVVGLLLLLSLRSAWKARWKGGSASTLFFYGVHSHLQQVPIFLGQRQFQRNRKRGERQTLLEYK